MKLWLAALLWHGINAPHGTVMKSCNIQNTQFLSANFTPCLQPPVALPVGIAREVDFTRFFSPAIDVPAVARGLLLLLLWTMTFELGNFDMNTKALTIAAALLLSIGTASAAPVNLVSNGDFTSSTYTANSEFGSGQYQGGQGVTGWTAVSGYDLYFTSAATSSTQSALGQFAGSGLEKLYGPVAASPTGGAFVALDGDTGYNGTISQTITGLTVGTNYALSFNWAAAQLQSRVGNTTSSLTATLGGQSFSTAAVANPSGGFTGWMQQTFTFTATSAMETLSFLSSGTPAGSPPIAALDGVSLVAVPEPASFALLGIGMIGLGFMRRRRTAI